MSEKFVDKMKKMMGFSDSDEDEDEDEALEDEVIPFSQKNNANKLSNKVVNIHATTQMKVMIYDPIEYDESANIVDNLKNRKAVIVNLENIEDPELVKNIFHFISGAVYALDGSIQKVSKGIFILAPSNIDIDGNIKKELESKGLFPWQKQQ